MALTKVKFSKRADVAEMAASSFKSESRVELNNGDRYEIAATDLGSGVLLASGNYANKILDTAILLTGGGVLTAGGVINQLQDSNAGYLIPLANSVPSGTILVVEVEEWKSDQTPTLTRQGSDLIRELAGTDTSIVWAGEARLTLTSDGTSEWRL